MEKTDNTCLIGVDGGGTACRLALTWAGQRHEITLGAANAATDRVGAIATVRAGIQQLAERAGLDSAQLEHARVHVALAGVMSPADEQAMTDGLGLAHVTVSDDRISTVIGALGKGVGKDDGAVAGIGTGSFLARQADGKVRFVGGWGLDLGDEASGAWLGRGMLASTLRVEDGLTEGSALSDEMRRRFDGTAGIVAFASKATPGELAELAPSIVAAAEAGDRLATALMQAGADYILHGLKVLGWSMGEPACLIGGLAASYRPWLHADLQGSLRAQKGSALDGALQLAAFKAGKP